MEKKSPFCTLTDQELIEKTTELIQQLIDTGGKLWVLNIPARPNSDPDLIFTELNFRFKNLVERPMWVKASERLPEFDSPLPLKIDSLYRMGNFYHEEGKNKLYVQGPEPYILYEDKFGGVEWLDESGTPTAGREESDAVDHEFIDFIVNERDAISKEMLSDTWWLEIPAVKRVAFENVLIAYDQMVEILKKEK